ncbi:MAG: CCA tRNA nucleotidyltransferase [Candidatus Aenigmarchaeota archaeon]|nr:CCA tRNA nucleotidyltransferase [Candidatus Aenigmarchaeota archaeon]
MVNYQTLLSKVLKKTKPRQADEKKLNNLSKKALEITREIVKKYQGKAILAGSITRGTWLPNKREFDIFILFPEDLPENKLEEHGLLIGKQVIKQLKGKSFVEYAQHPYVSGVVDGVDIDIVPCYEVESAEKIKSAVDRTPFHVRYIEKNLSLELSDDVRLLKQFLTSNKIYGADAKTQGFSGYVCELLVIRYGGFLEVIKAASKWVPGSIIDLENYYKKEDHHKLRKIFKNQPLILIDPTDRNRNTASALSIESFLRFVKLSKGFLDRPNVKYFSEKKLPSITGRELKQKRLQRKTELLFIKFSPPKVVPDILWPQLRRFAERLQSILEETKYEFKVMRKDVYSNEKDLVVVLLEMEIPKLPPIQKRVGPTVFAVKDSSRFLEKYKKPLTGPFVEESNWVVEINRKFVSSHEKLVDSLKKSNEILKSKGIPNYIADQLSKGFEIFSDDRKILKLVKRDKNFGVFLKKYFEKESLV